MILMGLLGLAVALPATVLIDSGDEGAQAPPPLADLGTAVEVPALGPGASDRGLGVDYRLPRGWSDEKEASALRLRSGDRGAEIVIAAPAPASGSEAVLDEALAAIRRGYEDVRIARGSGREVGGLDAKGAVVSARAEGVDLRIVVAVATGAGRTYLVEVFTAAGVSAETLREAQVALNSLQLGAA